MSGFLCTYGLPASTITCCACRKHTRMVPARGNDITRDDVARYKAIHVCGAQGRGWDVGDDGSPAGQGGTAAHPPGRPAP